LSAFAFASTARVADSAMLAIRRDTRGLLTRAVCLNGGR